MPGAVDFVKADAQPAAPGQADAIAKRKIIYTASIDLVVTEFEEAGRQLQRIVSDSGGYIAKSDVGILTGERRKATWTLRIPVAKFQATMDALAQLGHALNTRHDSQDITDEFFDLEARLTNKQVEEKRLLEHLQKSTGKLEDILAVEKEITRVRGEIELVQGRLQKLSKLSELTTITVTMQERKDYVPPTAPTYATTVGQTFGGSLDALISLFRGLSLMVVALVPWLPLIALAIGVPWWLIRRSRRSVPMALPASASLTSPGRSSAPAGDS